MKKAKIFTCATAITVMALGISGCKSDKSAAQEEQPEETIDVALPTIDSVVLHREYPGTLRAKDQVDLVARVDGYYIDSYYEPGTIVQKGAVLFRLDDSQYRNAVNQAQAQLATARATYAYNSKQYEAMKKALESDAVSQMEVIQAESAMKESAASIKNAEAALHTAQLNLSYCTVRAPFTGRMSKGSFSEGAYISGAASPVTLGTLYDDTYLNAYFAIEDAQYLQMLNDARANKEIDYDSIPLQFPQQMLHKYKGTLNYLAPEIDPSTGTMSIRARVDNPYGELKSGQYVKVLLPYKVDPQAILIKDAAIGTDQQGKYVYVVNNENKVVYTPIEVGELVNDTLRIVNSGLSPDDKYVTKALLKVRDGMTVKPNLTK